MIGRAFIWKSEVFQALILRLRRTTIPNKESSRKEIRE